MNRLLTKI